jgi:hypothetical protein
LQKRPPQPPPQKLLYILSQREGSSKPTVLVGQTSCLSIGTTTFRRSILGSGFVRMTTSPALQREGGGQDYLEGASPCAPYNKRHPCRQPYRSFLWRVREPVFCKKGGPAFSPSFPFSVLRAASAANSSYREAPVIVQGPHRLP